MTALQDILEKYRATAQPEREKETYLKELVHTYTRHDGR